MKNILITRETPMAEIMDSPAGQDIIMKALYQVGISGDILKKGPLSKLTLVFFYTPLMLLFHFQILCISFFENLLLI